MGLHWIHKAQQCVYRIFGAALNIVFTKISGYYAEPASPGVEQKLQACGRRESNTDHFGHFGMLATTKYASHYTTPTKLPDLNILKYNCEFNSRGKVRASLRALLAPGTCGRNYALDLLACPVSPSMSRFENDSHPSVNHLPPSQSLPANKLLDVTRSW